MALARLVSCGGTAMAIQCGHRQSVDLDFFTSKQELSIETTIKKLAVEWHTTLREKGTLYGELFDTKVSFIVNPNFKPSSAFHAYGSITILDIKDIAVMKPLAVSRRGTKRDFFDLFWYAEHKEGLSSVFSRFPKHYPHRNYNLHHILKGLMYFEDADNDPDPVIFLTQAGKR